MQEEARNTEGHSRDWRTSSNLRHKAVQFVKAGHVQRSEFETIETAEEDGELQVDDQPATAAFQSDPESRAEPQEATEPRDLSAVMLPRMDDVKHPTSLHLDQAPSDFHESSDSSEDEVVFTGRKPSMRPVVIETSQAELDLMFQNHAQETEVVKSTPAPTMDSLTTGKPQSDSSHARVQKNKRDTRGWTRKDEDDMLADYIANMDSDYLEALGVQQGEHRRKNEDKQSAEESSSDEDGAASIISAEFRALLKGDSKEDSGRNSIDSGEYAVVCGVVQH